MPLMLNISGTVLFQAHTAQQHLLWYYLVLQRSHLHLVHLRSHSLCVLENSWYSFMKLSFIFLILNLSFFFFCDLFKMQHDEQVIRVIKFVLIQSYYYVFVSMFYFLHDLFIFFQHLFSTCSGNFAYVSNYIWFGHICSCKINKK